MRLYYTFIVLILSAFTFDAQAQSGVGKDNIDTLNQAEIALLDSIFALKMKEGIVKDSVDLSGKKVAFVTGPTGGRIIVKSNFFLNNVLPWIRKKEMPVVFPIELSAEEKVKSSGYDVILLVWVKEFTDVQKERIVNQLPEFISE